MGSPSWQAVVEAAAGDVRRLSFVTRYSSIPISVKENVGEHSFWVALYAAMIHRAARPADGHLAGAILLKAVIHDQAECVTGDIVRTFKYSSQALKDAIDEAESLIIDRFPKPIVDLYAFQEDLSGMTERGRGDPDVQYVEAVVKAGDFLSLQQYMNREWLRGNREIEGFFDRMVADLRMMQEKVAAHPVPDVAKLAELYGAMADSARNKKAYTT